MSEIRRSDIQEILEYLPHRFPFLLIDHITNIQLNKSIQAIKNTTMNEPFYQGHFPGNPIFPGVLMLESMAQAAGVLIFKSKNIQPGEKLYVYAGVTKARFKNLVRPGDQLVFDVTLKNERRNVVFLSAVTKVGDSIVCEADFTIIGVSEEDLERSIQHKSSTVLDFQPIEADPISQIEMKDILQYLPHRYPFLLIDRVLSVSGDGKKIRALKSTTVNEPFYQGHFPEQPVFPGVMLLEAMAQAAGIMAAKDIKDNNQPPKLFVFAGIDKAKFKLIVQPGDQLIFDVEEVKRKGNIAFYLAKATVCGDVVCTAELMSASIKLDASISNTDKIHPQAIVDPQAKIGNNVEIGPWSYIGPGVEIGNDTVINSHVVIKGPTTIGSNNRIFQFASVGDTSQDISCNSTTTRLEIGDNNEIRECVTIHRGTTKDKGLTKIGSNNLFMAYSHIAHDCVIGNNIIFSNNASLAGHVTVNDNATIGAFSAVHQFCVVGSYSFLARAAMVPQDVPPYINVIGGNAEPHGINAIGLQRKGFSDDAIRGIKEGYKIIYRQNLTLEDALNKLIKLAKKTPEVQAYVDFIKASKRGIVR